MSERLAIKTDQVEEWKKGKLGPAIKNLTPRPTDQGLKSSWAHCVDEGDLPEILADPSKASCTLQAFALYFFSERVSKASRNRVAGVSLLREAIKADLVIEDQNPHPISAYSATHRSLVLADEQVRRETAEGILTARAFEDWEYTKDEMAELLEYLLEAGQIDSSMEKDARSLLLQWTS